MGLTQQQRLLQQRDPNHFPAAQLFVLALIRLAEPIALTSILPYAWKLCLHYGFRESDAAFYAGILIAAFSLSEALTGMYWGSLSDRIGRKPVLLMGNAGTLMALLILGLAPNFWVALAGRIIGGLLNGNVAVIQTMVGELVTNPKHEPKAFAVIPFVWSIGTIVGPAVGCLADPVRTLPSLFSPGGLFDSNPYLLPNLVCAALLFGSILAGYFFLFETHPDMQPWSTKDDLDYTSATTPLIPATGAVNNAAADLTTEFYGTFVSVEIVDERGRNVRDKKMTRSGSETSMSSIGSASQQKVFTRQVIQLTVALGIFTYHSMTYDYLMPIFFQDARWQPSDDVSIVAVNTSTLAGGLGFTTQQVGIIMSVNGVIALFVQGLVFPTMASWFGVWRLFVLVTIGHPLAYFVMPYLVLLPERYVYAGLYSCLFLRNFFTILAYPLLLILIKEAAPSKNHLGKINGLAASTGGACRTIASPVAGFLYGLGTQMDFTPLAWWSSCAIATIGALQVPWIQQTKNKTAHVHSASEWANQDVEVTPTKEETQALVVEVEFSTDDEV